MQVLLDRSMLILLCWGRLVMCVMGRRRMACGRGQRTLLSSQGGEFCAVWRKQSVDERVFRGGRQVHTIESSLSEFTVAHYTSDGSQTCPKLLAFLQRAVAVGQRSLEFLVWLLALELTNARLEAFDGVLSAFADSPLGFAIVCSLLR